MYVCVHVHVYVYDNSIKNYTDEGTSVCVSQLCARRNVSTAAVCLRIHASASPDGADWTAPVVSALSFKPTIIHLDSFYS